MCGKSIRVPNLDGTIEPIPSPEFDLKDSQLVEALGELAEIGRSHSRTETTTPPRVSETYEATLIVPAVPAQPAPSPKAVPAPSVAAHAQEDSDTIIQAGGDVGTVVERDDPLRDLAESSAILPPARPHQRWKRDRRSVWLTGLFAAMVIAVLALVWLNAGSDAKPPALEAASGESSPTRAPGNRPSAGRSGAEPHAPPLTGNAAAAGETAVFGRVTYVSENGDTRPDSGARILLLPRSKPGTVKLDVAGFLAGAEQVDADVARAAIRAMGGELATADEEGHYQLAFRSGGEYDLLVISRHRSRESTSPVESKLQDALSAYFFRPASLLGNLSFRFEEFHDRGPGTSARDFSFSDP